MESSLYHHFSGSSRWIALACLLLQVSNGSANDQIHFFENRVRPLLANNCYECHGEAKQKHDLRLDSLQGMLTGGKGGPALAPGKPKGSLMLTAVTYHDNDLKMPPDGKLSEQQIADLARWIELGAPHPDSGNVMLPKPKRGIDLEEGRKHWAFQSPIEPDVPEAKSKDSFPPNNPIDAFLRAKMESRQLEPLGRADKRLLIRRATFDLIGLPPTLEEIDMFLADESADAFQKVIDRLLASPHYGERWGRHWLDVVRYADSNGLDENVAHGNAWRYRDYVVRSLNNDKPFDQFITEQLAGDLLDSGDDLNLKHERLIATGYLVLGPKVLAEVDESKMEMDIVDEQVDTIGRGLMGLTLGCARCHDHKFDPIGQGDYYGLAGIFKSTRAMENFKKVAKWNENSIATPEQLEEKKRHDEQITRQINAIEKLVAEARAELELPAGETAPSDVEKRFPIETQKKLGQMRAEQEKLEESVPVLPTAMGVSEGKIENVPIHLRGSHLTLGEVVPRRFPQVIAGINQPLLPNDQSGRLQFARWLTTRDHPLTARVMVNRIWHWHFGKGLAPTVDNFGIRGEVPTHPELLDWLAVKFVEEGWSLKAMHRLIMSSAAYQRSSDYQSQNAALDPENQLYWRFDLQRLEAEAIRDALLAVSGKLDLTIGGNLLTVKNRDYLFNHTSEDKAKYGHIRRRSIYVPVIRNHLYDFFQLFDYTDASMMDGERDTSTVAPQALMLMNSELVTELTTAMANRFLELDLSSEERIKRLFIEAYARPPKDSEIIGIKEFLNQSQQLAAPDSNRREMRRKAWQMLCQSIVSSSEFVYVR